MVPVARKELRIHRSKLDGDGLNGDMIREILLDMAAIGFIQSSTSHWEGDTCVIEIFPGQDLSGFTHEQLWTEYTKQLAPGGAPRDRGCSRSPGARSLKKWNTLSCLGVQETQK